MERNIVILGKVGSGKRTLANHICDTQMFKVEHGAQNVLGTRSAKSFDGQYRREKDNTVYRILTVDTESVNTGYNDPIQRIATGGLDMVHSIIFVIAHGRYTDESHALLLRVVNSLKQQAKSISALVITHCEGMQNIQRKGITNEFANNPRGSQIVSFMERGVYAVGFVDVSTYSNLPHLEPIIKGEIEKDEETIRNMLQRCDLPMRMEELISVQAINKPARGLKGESGRCKDVGSQSLPLSRESKLNRQQLHPAPQSSSHKEPKTATLVSVEGESMDTSLSTSSILRPNEKSVIILGKVGSGKRTIGKHIAQGSTSGAKTLFDSAKKGIISGAARQESMFYEQFTEEDTLYKILTIDTESVGQSYANPIPYIKKHFENVNLIIFVIPHGLYTPESHGSLTHTVENIHYKATAISALIINHCEGMKPEARDDAIAKFRADSRSARIAAFMGKGIYTVGFPPLSPESKIGSEALEYIRKDEMIIINLLKECEATIRADDLLPPGKQISNYSRPTMQPYYATQATQATQVQNRCIVQ